MNLLPPEDFNTALISCWKRLQSGRRIVVHRSLIGITGDIKSAAYLSQLLYWLRVGVDINIRDGWILKSIAETQNETGLSKTEQGLCKEKLRELGLIQIARIGQGARLAVKVNLEAVSAAICKLFDLNSTAELTIEEWRKQELGFIRDYFSDSVVYHLDLVWLTGDIHSAVILSNALFQSARRGTPGSSAFNKQRLYYSATMTEWEEATTLRYKPQRRARDLLKSARLIVEAHYNQSARIFTHVDGLRLIEMLEQKIRLAQKPELNVGKLKALLEAEAAEQQPDAPQLPQPESPVLETPESDDINYHSRSKELANSEVTNGQTQKLGSEESANLEISNGESQKSGSKELANSEVTNGQTIYKSTYNNHPTDEPTTTTQRESKATESASVNVVVVSDALQSGQQTSRFEELIWPKIFNGSVRIKAEVIFDRYYAQGNAGQLQEILDEIAGQTAEVRSPLGLLTMLVKAASAGTLVCVQAPIVQEKRIQAEKYRQMIEQQQAAVPPSEPPLPPVEAKQTTTDERMPAGREALRNMKYNKIIN